MKKNLIAIAVAAAVIAPLTAQAVDDDFDVDISGDARLRYYTNFKKHDALSKKGPYVDIQKGAQTDSRFGLNVQGTYGKEVMLKGRLEFENIHDSQYTNDYGPEEPSTNTLVSVDHAYISVNVGAGVNVTGGSTIENWGHKLYMWDDVGDRVSITKKFSDIELGLHYSKDTEYGLPLNSGSDHTDGKDGGGTHLTLKWGEMGGIRHDRYADGGDSGSWKTSTDIYATIPVADWTVAFEYLRTKDSEQEHLVNDLNKTALLVAGIGKVASTDLMVGYASVAGGLSTDDDFLPFVGTGTNPGSMLPYLATERGTTESVMFVIADVPVGTVNLQGSIASISEEGPMSGEPDDVIIGFKVSQAISKNTTVTGEYARFSGDSFDGRMMGAHIEIEF